MIVDKRHFIASRWRLLMLLPGVMAAFAISIVAPRESPALLFLGYGALVFAFGYRRSTLTPTGFQIRNQPWLCGVRNWDVPLNQITQIFRRYLYVYETESAPEHQFFVAAELRSGVWVHLLGPFPTAPLAEEQLARVAALWPTIPVGDGRRGYHQSQRRPLLRALAFWGGGAILALSLSVAGTVWRAAG